jgi:DNA invertase Pin-like site-specific DNA recombinase
MSIEKFNGYRYGYARVSTGKQDEAMQLDALTAAGCDRIFTDRVSGTLEHRPGLDTMLEQLRPGDIVLVWRLDRLGRSLKHLLNTVSLLQERGVGFRSLNEDLDTTSPTGRLIFHVLASLSQFERDLTVERTQAGLLAARARGRVGGRPRVMTPEKLQMARSMYDTRIYDVAAIGRVLGVSRASIYRALGKAKSD